MMKAIKFRSLFFLVISFVLLVNVVSAIDQKTIGDKIFDYKNNYWVDQKFNNKAEAIEIRYNGVAYKQLQKDNEQVAEYLALGENIKINLDGHNLIINKIGFDDKVLAPEEQSLEDKIYIWSIIIILAVFFIAALIFIIISIIHKRQRYKE